jgi:hypothetical protein
MSKVSISTITPKTGNAINIQSGHLLKTSGQIVQVQTVRTDTLTTYSSATTGNGTTMSALAINITPKFSDSILVMQYMINAECQVGWDNMYVMHMDGALITTSPVAYNSNAGNLRYSGIAPAGLYDANDSSTISGIFLQYAVNSGSTTARTYAPAVRSSSATAYTLYLNRTLTSATGAQNYEITVSTGMIMEIV